MNAAQTVADTLNAIRPVDASVTVPVQAHLDDLTKPQGSLGRLESIAMTIIEAAIRTYNEMATFSGAGVSHRE